MKQVEALYFSIFKKPLAHYKHFKVIKPINKQAYILLGLFVLILTVFILELFNVLETNSVPIAFMIVVTLLCLFLPIYYIIYYKRQNVYFTDKAMIKQTLKNQYIAMPFDKVKRVLTDHEKRLMLFTNEDKMTIKFNLYEEDIKTILTLFKYKGFFKDAIVDYEISFENNRVNITELEEIMDEDTSHLYEKYINKYNFLTPGFFDEIIFYNNQISRIQLTEAKHVVFYLSHVDVKPNHPENTKFKAQKSDEAIVIFENVADVEILNIGEGEEKDSLLGINIQTLRETTKNAIIFEADVKAHDHGQHIEFIMSHGVKKQRVRFVFTEVIVGWNKLVNDSWFEK
ncbi:MAG: hypothetical protein ACLFRI_02920 [Candidatus Izemoplasmataceae bacterium]